MSKPSGTNSPNDFLYRGPFSHPRIVKYSKEGVWVKRTLRYHVVSYNNVDLGGYSSGVPPLPIPNREVKPVHADGTAVTCGRVGSRLLRVLRAFGGLFFVRILIGVVSVVVRGNELRFRTEGDCFLVSFWFFFCFFCKYAFGYCYYLYYYYQIYIFIILLNVHVWVKFLHYIRLG